MSIKYTSSVGQKFNKDLSVRQFPGNTIICFVDPELHPTIFKEVSWAQHQLQAMACAGKFNFLPPDSFHMTVLELLCEQIRTQDYWSSHLPISASLDETDRFFIEQSRQIQFPSSFAMKFAQARYPATLKVEPADAETAKSLVVFREQMAELLGVRRPNFDEYEFHITLGYNLIGLEQHEIVEQTNTFEAINQRLTESFGRFETSAPALTFFDDMAKFVREPERLSLASRAK